MAIEKIEVDVATCDACGAVQYLLDIEVPNGWFSGEATFLLDGESVTGLWHACRAAHIKKAVMTSTGQVDE